MVTGEQGKLGCGKRKPGVYVARQHGYEKEQCVFLETPGVKRSTQF